MADIRVLSSHVANLIAAGEVVERPASTAKELVENAVDAGSKSITVEIKCGGIEYLRVTDDGCGIYRDDIKVAFLRHATSKVKREQDLESIATLGFRGEALASICAVSRLQLITRNINEDIGTTYQIEGGEEVSFEDAGCPVGTTFVIRDLFYNIPARAKFLKKDTSEGTAVANIIDKTALSHPEIAFTFIRDGKQVLKTFGDGKLISAIYSVFGKDFRDSLIPVEYTLDAIKIKGYVSKPVNSRPNRNMQNFFINGRYVKTRTAMAALEEAFKGSIMVGKFPSCVLNIELPFEIIDVNVHPAKIEVRFINERPVFDAVYHAVKSALMKYDSRKNASFKTNSAFNELNGFNPFHNAQAILKKPVAPTTEKVVNNKPEKNPINNTTQKKNDFNPFEEISFVTPQKTVKKQPEKVNIDETGVRDSVNPFDLFSKSAINKAKAEEKFKPQKDFPVHNTVVEQKPVEFKADEKVETEISTESKINDNIEIIEKVENTEVITTETTQEIPKSLIDDEPMLIKKEDVFIKYIGEAFDTYIIAEKNNKEILFIDKHAAHERMIYEKLKNEKAASFSQILLQPITVTLGKKEYDAAVNNIDMFKDCAFEIEDFGNSTVIVRSAPQYLDAADISDCVVEMADYISMGKNDIMAEKMDWFYHNVACRSAIKAGNRSTSQELIELVKKLEENPQIRYCPHGRPVCIVMTKSEIEKQFGRV